MRRFTGRLLITQPLFTPTPVAHAMTATQPPLQWHSIAKNLPQLCAGVYLSLATLACPAQTLLHKTLAAKVALPVPTSTSPSNLQQYVPIDSPIEVNFDRPVLPGTGHFLLSNGQGDNRVISVLDGNQVAVFGNTLHIVPSKPLLPDTQYAVQMEDATLTDTSGNALPGVKTTTAFSFRTAPLALDDRSPPIALSVTPRNGATEVDPNTPIKVAFNEPIKAGVGQLILSNGVDDTRYVGIHDPQRVRIYNQGPSGGQLDIVLNQPLKYNSNYTLKVPQGVVTDNAGNPLVVNATAPVLTFKTLHDITPPVLADSHANEVALTLSFSETLKLGTGAITLVDPQGNKRVLPIHDFSQVIIDGVRSNNLNLLPADHLVVGATYSVIIPQGVVTDLAGNPFPGVAAGQLKVAVKGGNILPTDTQPPQPVSSVPSTNQTGVLVGSPIEIRFDEAVAFGSGHFVLSNGQGDTRVIASTDSSQVSHPDSYVWGKAFPDSTAVRIKPQQDLLANSRYFVQMEANGVHDGLGNVNNAVLSTEALTFTTAADGRAPQVLRVSPANHSEQVPLNAALVAQFNEPIKAGGYITLSSSPQNSVSISTSDTQQVSINGAKIIIHPSEPLVPGTYSLLVSEGAVTDLTGNPVAAVTDPQAYTFSTVAALPSLKLYSMAASHVDKDGLMYPSSPIMLRFNRPIHLGSGHITLSNGQGDTRVIDIKDAAKIIPLPYTTPSFLQILPSQPLLNNSRYFVQIDGTAILDSDGQGFAGVYDTATLTLTTTPSKAPEIQRLQLSNVDVVLGRGQYSSPLPVDGEITLYFDVAFNLKSGMMTLSNGQGDTRRIDIRDTTQVINGSNRLPGINALTIKPAKPLLFDSMYSIQLDKGIITDTGGTPFAGLHDSTSIAFVTENTRPAAALQNPVELLNTNQLVFNFNVPVLRTGGVIVSTPYTDGGLPAQHSLGDNDLVLSPDGRSISVLLDKTSTVALGDTVTFLGVINANDSGMGSPTALMGVDFTLK